MPTFGFGTITSQGVGSNINIAGIVDELMQIERIPLIRLEEKKTSYDAKISALGTIKSSLSSLQTVLAGLTSGTSILANKATSSDTSFVSATGTSGAVAGNYTISNITQLAQSQKLVAAGQADATVAIGGGTSTTLTIELGTIADPGVTFDSVTGKYGVGTTFTAGSAGSFNVVIDSSNNTLEGIRDAINTANQGVTATIVNDGDPTNPYRLVLSSTASGADQSIKIAVDPAGDASLITLLDHDPAGTQNLAETVTAKDAKFDVDGIAITKSSNTITDVISGVTLNLNAENPTGSLIVSVSQDTDSAKAAVLDFVNAYNGLLAEINKQTDSGYSGGVAGALASDSATRQILSFVRDELTTAPTGITGTYTNLSSIGVSFQRDGTLAIDDAELTTAIQTDSNNVADLFSSADGYGTRLDSVMSEMLVYNGTIDTRTNAFNDNISTLEDRQVTLESRLTRTEARLRAKFTALDVLIASMTSTNNALSQQLDALTGFTSNGK
jgi:flagellar hook-associated protein 2